MRDSRLQLNARINICLDHASLRVRFLVVAIKRTSVNRAAGQAAAQCDSRAKIE